MMASGAFMVEFRPKQRSDFFVNRHIQHSQSSHHLPLLGREIRDLFIDRLTSALAAQAVHLFCSRDEATAAARDEDLVRLLEEFLRIYIPLIRMANYLCDLEEDWLRETKQVWHDLRHLVDATLRRHADHPFSESTHPPRATRRIKCMDDSDPLGAIMDRRFDAVFSRALKGPDAAAFDPKRFL